MAIYDFFLSRNKGPTVANYVGHTGRLFYDPAERVLRISNGSTMGGEVFNGYVAVSATEPTQNFEGQVWLDPDTSALSIYHNNEFIPTVNVATETILGGVKLGPGVVTNPEGQIIIDSSGLDFSFGDIVSITGQYEDSTSYAVLKTINPDEDLYLVSNGTGSIDVIGQFNVYKTDGDVAGAILADPVFRVKSDGQIVMLVPGADEVAGALAIVGSSSGEFIAPVNTGVMIHVTGNFSNPGIPSRIYNDSQNAFGAWVTRRFNGIVASPTAVLANEEIMRLSGTAHNGTEIPGTANQRIVYVARGNQTTSNQGGAIELWATPLNSITLAKVATVESTGIALESGKVLSGNVTGNVTGDVTGNASGNAGSVTNGVYTIGDQSIGGTKTFTSTISGSISGNAGTVTNGVYTTGNQSIGGTKTFTSTISGSISGNAGTVTNGVYTTDTATVTNTMLAGSIANNKLTNSSVTVNGTSIALGASGTVTAAAGTLTGTTLNSTVVTSSLTSVGTLGSLTVTNTITGSVSGSAGSVAAANITGTTLASNVVTSSLTSVGTLGSLAVTNSITATNYTGLVTHSIRNAGNATGTTLTLNVTTDDIVKCTFTDAFTVAFSNIIAGRVITLIATNTSAGDTDIITAGISSVNMQGDNTLTITEQTTAVITYYSLDGDVANIYASARFV